MKEEVKLIPIDRIRIINPRHRDRKKFEVIVQSIRNLGLKKPIQVSVRTAKEGAEPGYDLVCGQGRIEAFTALGHKEIPAIIVSIPKEDRLLRSLVENMARRHPTPSAMMQEILRLKTKGYNNTSIGKKLDLSDTCVSGYLSLHKQGEQRLLEAALTGKIPVGIAIDIATTKGRDAQRELLTAYEKKQLNQAAIRTVKRLIAHRHFLGKDRSSDRKTSQKKPATAETFVSAYRRESERQNAIIKKARVFDTKLTFLVSAFKKLSADESFVNLLRAESLSDMPRYLAERVKLKHGQSI